MPIYFADFHLFGDLEQTKCCKACLADFQLFRSSSIEVVFHGGRLIFVFKKSIVLN